MYVYVLYQEGITEPRQGVQGSRDVYVGVAQNVTLRLKAHNSGKVKATRGMQWRIAAYYRCTSMETAFTFERWLKRGNSLKKRLEFVKHFNTDGLNSLGLVWMEEKAVKWAEGRQQVIPLPVRWR